VVQAHRHLRSGAVTVFGLLVLLAQQDLLDLLAPLDLRAALDLQALLPLFQLDQQLQVTLVQMPVLQILAQVVRLYSLSQFHEATLERLALMALPALLVDPALLDLLALLALLVGPALLALLAELALLGLPDQLAPLAHQFLVHLIHGRAQQTYLQVTEIPGRRQASVCKLTPRPVTGPLWLFTVQESLRLTWVLTRTT